MKKFLFISLAIMILSTSLVACNTNTETETKTETPTETSTQPQTESLDVLPSSIDLRNYKKNVVAKGIVNNGESYIFTEGNWTDATNLKDTYLQQAYEHNINDDIDDSFKASSVDYVTIDNYPIKGISIPVILIPD